MFENMTEAQAKEKILAEVKEYCDTFHNQKKDFKEGDRIPYASRVYDSEEMTNLVDSALEFWLTSGRYTDQFEKDLAKYLGVKYASLVNSGSSANLIAFSALTSPLLKNVNGKDRKIYPGDEVITVAAGFPTTVTPIIQYGAVPVFVDMDIPSYNKAVNLGWQDKIDLEGELKALTGLNIKGGNDANVAALGEVWKGGAEGYTDAVVVTLGTGIGGGVIIGGKVL